MKKMKNPVWEMVVVFFFKELKQQFESRFDPPHKQTTVTIVWGGSQSNNNIKFTDNK